jgi:choline dehydrogenase-like flavoprotein
VHILSWSRSILIHVHTGGPSGSTVAARLASTSKKPSVLLVEAGESRLDKESLVGFDRWPFAPEVPGMNWPITTVPQQHLGGKQITLPTGKVLGGSSAINVALWTVGHAADYDEWARIVGDESFAWNNVRRHLKRLENYGRIDVVDLGKYSNQEKSNHGTDGEVQIRFSDEVVRQAVPIMDAFVESGLPVNPDLNSGSSLGVGMIPFTVKDGWRSSAATAFLTNPPQNLTIKTKALVTKILFEGTKATGIAVGDEVCVYPLSNPHLGV